MPEPEYKNPYPHTNYVPMICSECGASIVKEPLVMLRHSEFHAKMDELIDWAQHISKLLGGQSEAGIQHDGA